MLIGLLLPALLASMRAVSVGSDVSFYVVPLFNKAINSNSFSYYVAILGGDINDIGYCLLNYIISRFTTEIGWLFFATELIIVFYICRMLETQRKSLSMVEYAILLFLFYNITLSTVRQSCALAISFLHFPIFLKSNLVKMLLSSLLSV